jgi:hypothetical protein
MKRSHVREISPSPAISRAFDVRAPIPTTAKCSRSTKFITTVITQKLRKWSRMPPAGLCETCCHCQSIRSDRGGVFLMCRRGLTDPAYPKYPRLPVVQCAGFNPNQ